MIFYGVRCPELSPAAQAAMEKLIAAADSLILQKSNYLCGEWTIADVDLALILNRLRLHGDPIPQRLADYAQEHWEHPSVQLWVNHIRPPL